MGHLKEKYTEEYYTGIDKDGKQLPYGANSSLDENGVYTLRNHDRKILEKVKFKGQNVLALGCGRGEELAYAIENGANHKDSIGVDFSSAAIAISKKLIKDKKLKSPQLFTEDALDFVLRFQKEVKKNASKKIDVVVMFDFVEHIPRHELSEIMATLKNITTKDAILVVNTPAYKYDNDVIANGYDERNIIGTYDKSDEVPETKGMHCNKYSAISLQDYMRTNAYENITEAHYYIGSEVVPKGFGSLSYYDRWLVAKKLKLSITGEYSDDVLEYPYNDLDGLRLIKFNSGNLDGVSIITTETYRDIAYPDGNTDPEMMSSIKKMNPTDKVIFDVGTFVGVCSMLFSKMVGKNGKVLGFEPNPSNRNRTFLNLSHNPDLLSNISIYKNAFGSENKNQDMFLSSQIDNGYSSTSRLEGSHSTIRSNDLPDGFEDVEVEVKTLDTFVAEENIIPDILKVDIEGAEYDFLLGAIETIRKSHPIFYIELHSQYCASKCTELLVIEGYSIQVLHEEEDNRVMVLAKYTNKSQDGANIEALRSIDASITIIKNMSENISTLSKDSSIKNIEIIDLIGANNNLRAEKERADVAESINKVLQERLELIQSSRTWALTKPLRKAVYIVKSIKK